MVEGIEQFYQQIAESMLDHIPEDWSVAIFEAMFFPQGSVYEAEYRRQADNVARDFRPASSGDRAFRQLRRAFQDEGKLLWGKARFELYPDGKFNLKLGYDDYDEKGDAHFDEEQELRRREERHRRLTQA
jgi:hypothetical protein